MTKRAENIEEAMANASGRKPGKMVDPKTGKPLLTGNEEIDDPEESLHELGERMFRR